MVTSLLERYNQLKVDYESYQKMAEKTIQKQNEKIRELDKKLDMLSSIIEISQYINKCLGSDELISKINDIMIGILGVNYSSIYIMENRKLKLKFTNLFSTNHHYKVQEYNNKKVDGLTPYLINSIENVCLDRSIQIHSSLFMPIRLKEELLGAILVEHNIYGYLNQDDIKLLSALSNQIAICIENNRLYNKIKENSQRDFLTGLFNRNYFFSAIGERIKNCGDGFAIVMVDVDNFKKCNDTFGHQYGDMVLKNISSIIKNNIRNEDMVARYGGEEIIIYMYDTREIMNVYSRMDGIRKIIEKSSVEYNGKLCPVTVSMGISLSHDKNENIEDMIKRADMNLYKAKNSGKNKVVC